MPSYFGGGDLDGDMYNVTTVPQDLLPPRQNLQKPASYAAAKRKYLKRPSTMKDVADFVTEFIISDVRIQCAAAVSAIYSTSDFIRTSVSFHPLG